MGLSKVKDTTQILGRNEMTPSTESRELRNFELAYS